MPARGYSIDRRGALGIAIVPACLAVIAALFIYRGIADSEPVRDLHGSVPIDAGPAAFAWLFAGRAICASIMLARFWMARHTERSLAMILTSLVPYGLLTWNAVSLYSAAGHCPFAAPGCGDVPPHPTALYDATVAILALLLALAILVLSHPVKGSDLVHLSTRPIVSLPTPRKEGARVLQGSVSSATSS